MRDHSSEVAVGFFLGVVVVMAFDMFSLCVLFAGDAKRHAEGSDDKSASEATAVFSFFLAVAYGAFAVVLAKFRDEVIRVDDGGQGAADGKAAAAAKAGDFDGVGASDGAIVEHTGEASTV
jgi:hypothetical protein